MFKVGDKVKLLAPPNEDEIHTIARIDHPEDSLHRVYRMLGLQIPGKYWYECQLELVKAAEPVDNYSNSPTEAADQLKQAFLDHNNLIVPIDLYTAVSRFIILHPELF